MRLIGIGMIAAAVLAWGFWNSMNIQKRIKSLHQMQLILQLLKGEIGFTGRILEEAFADISSRIQEPFGSFFQTVSSQLQKRKGTSLLDIWMEAEPRLVGSGLNKSDLELFRRLAGELGFLDLDMQMRTLELLEDQIKTVQVGLEKEKDSTCKMYQSLGILGALSVILVMI